MSSILNGGTKSKSILAVRSRSGKTVWHTLSADKRDPRDSDIRVHSLESLDRVRSLEGLLDRFNVGEIVFDPSGGFERAARLVRAAKQARARLGKRLRALHLKANGRAVHARIAKIEDAANAAAVLGEEFARALAGSGLEIAMSVSTQAAPAGALPIERLVARQDNIARTATRVSTAVAVLGAATVGAFAQTARASTPQLSLPARENEISSIAIDPDRPVFILAGGVEERARPPRRPRPPVYQARPPRPATIPPMCPPTSGGAEPTMRSVIRVEYTPDGSIAALVLDATDPGRADEMFNRRAFALIRSLPPSALAALESAPELDGARIMSARRAGSAYVVTVGQCGAEPMPAPIDMPLPPQPEAPPPVIAPPPKEPDLGYSDVGVDYINRDVQEGGVITAVGQMALGGGYALNGQAAAGQIDGEFAGGVQAALQRFSSLSADNRLALGAFASAVTSEAPTSEDFRIYRGGVGAAFIAPSVQLVIRGGYAQSEGYRDLEGGFVRGEATWFVTPDLALDIMAEDDPITGSGYGVGTAFRPFTEIFPQLMIDADANWHQDGEDSFRVGVRWLFGAEEARTVRERRARQGMAPTLQVELERLPTDGKSDNTAAPYCGEAGACPS